MKRILLASALALSLVGTVPHEARAQSFTAFLTGNQEVPPVDTKAKSLAVFRFILNDRLFVGYRFNFFFDGEKVTDVHIHQGPVGVDGPVVLNLRPDGFCFDVSSFLTIYIATADQLRNSLAGMTLSDLKKLMTTGDTYINLHTVDFPDGWIRGQFPGIKSN